MHGNGVLIDKLSEERVATVLKREKQISADQNSHSLYTTCTVMTAELANLVLLSTIIATV